MSLVCKYEILYRGEVYPQYLHRYGYCANNPTNSIDPYGNDILSKLLQLYKKLPPGLEDLVFPEDANEGADFTQEELDRRGKSREEIEAEEKEAKKIEEEGGEEKDETKKGGKEDKKED